MHQYHRVVLSAWETWVTQGGNLADLRHDCVDARWRQCASPGVLRTVWYKLGERLATLAGGGGLVEVHVASALAQG